ncbi:MAG: helix-turn-helix domain-containing protein [Tissierellia bacterium]|nr:helix-turn-helix domain-containing protein [Tissierellia bacterium]
MNTKERIIEAAREEFTTRGFENISMRELARKARCTTGAIYGIFDGKEDLFRACVEEDIEYIKFRMDEADKNFHLPENPEEQEPYMRNHISTIITLLSELFTTYEKSLAMVLRRGEGKVYDDLMTFLWRMKYEANLAFYSKTTGGTELNDQVKLVISIMSRSTINAILAMMKKNWTVDEKKEYLSKIIGFQRAGWIYLTEKENE